MCVLTIRNLIYLNVSPEPLIRCGGKSNRTVVVVSDNDDVTSFDNYDNNLLCLFFGRRCRIYQQSHRGFDGLRKQIADSCVLAMSVKRCGVTRGVQERAPDGS